MPIDPPNTSVKGIVILYNRLPTYSNDDVHIFIKQYSQNYGSVASFCIYLSCFLQTFISKSVEITLIHDFDWLRKVASLSRPDSHKFYINLCY